MRTAVLLLETRAGHRGGGQYSDPFKGEARAVSPARGSVGRLSRGRRPAGGPGVSRDSRRHGTARYGGRSGRATQRHLHVINHTAAASSRSRRHTACHCCYCCCLRPSYLSNPDPTITDLSVIRPSVCSAPLRRLPC